MLHVYLELFDEGYFEIGEAFKELADEHVWQRPAESLLSVGEIAGHIAYWIAVRFAGDGVSAPTSENCRVSSPLLDPVFRYYTTSLDMKPSAELLAMTGEEVYNELVRVHKASIACFKELSPDLDSHPPAASPRQTYRSLLSYAVFHIGYHTGQMYTVRHLLGEQTPDN